MLGMKESVLGVAGLPNAGKQQVIDILSDNYGYTLTRATGSLSMQFDKLNLKHD
jgi:hypothetical protein